MGCDADYIKYGRSWQNHLNILLPELFWTLSNFFRNPFMELLFGKNIIFAHRLAVLVYTTGPNLSVKAKIVIINRGRLAALVYTAVKKLSNTQHTLQTLTMAESQPPTDAFSQPDTALQDCSIALSNVRDTNGNVALIP
jgi:hypothetical protein